MPAYNPCMESYQWNKGPLEYREEVAIKEMRIPLRNIMNEIGAEAEKGAYPLIIGDDASGRLPTLAMKRILDSFCKEKGLPLPETRFVTGSKRLSPEELQAKKSKLAEFFDETIDGELLSRLSAPGAKVLIMSDVVDTGTSLDPVIEELKARNIGYQVVSLSLLYENRQPMLEKKWGEGNYTTGDVGLPYLFGMQTISGVKKQPEELFSTPFKDPRYSEEEKTEIQRQINAARQMTDEVADGVYKEWREKEGK